MHCRPSISGLALAVACAAPLAAGAQSAPAGASAPARDADDAGPVVIRVQPEDPAAVERRKREALFRGLDDDTDGRISMHEAKGNWQLAAAFARLDADRDGAIDRREFGRVRFEEVATPARAQR